MTDRYYDLGTKIMLVMKMVVEITQEFKSTFKRRLEMQLYSELRRDYAFPRAVCRSLSDLFTAHMDLYFGSQRKEGQIVFHSISKEVPPGVPVEDMRIMPIKITVYSSDDCKCKNQNELLNKRILRITNEALNQHALLTQADLAIILNESTRTIRRHIKALEDEGKIIPTRGNWKDIGSGTSHKKRIVELYLKGEEYTDIERKTKHSGEAIMRYVKDFARILILHREEYTIAEIRVITGLSEKVIKEYIELVEKYSREEYKERLEYLESIFKKRTTVNPSKDIPKGWVQ